MQPSATSNEMQQSLSPLQEQAIELLVSGLKLRCVAEQLNIRRETLWRWRQLPIFQEAYHDRRDFMRAEMSEQITEIMRLSLVSLERELSRAETAYSNPIATALQVLRLMQPAQLLESTVVPTVTPP